MKWVIAIFLIIVVLVAGFYAFNNYIYIQKQGSSQDQKDMADNSVSENFTVNPISHASMVMVLAGQTIYNDPVGEVSLYTGNSAPDIILLSDIHGDHLEPLTLKTISTKDTVIVAPKAVAETLPKDIPGTVVLLANGESTDLKGIHIEAIPMYNVPESPSAPHTRGRGNGYVIEASGERIYIAGDTSNTPEMKALKDIDIAFIPMNLPYTMSVEVASEAVIAFKPKIVHPYHYRGPEGLSDINKFKELVEKGDPNIRVDLLNFYPEEK